MTLNNSYDYNYGSCTRHSLIARFMGANMGPIWGRQDQGGPHVGPMNFAIWVAYFMFLCLGICLIYLLSAVTNDTRDDAMPWKLLVICEGNPPSPSIKVDSLYKGSIMWSFNDFSVVSLYKPLKSQVADNFRGLSIHIMMFELSVTAMTVAISFSGLIHATVWQYDREVYIFVILI